MNDNTSIATKAASIILGLNRSGRKFGTSSSVGQLLSPYFNTVSSNQPLADLTNFYMKNMEKVPFKCNVPRTRMISSKEMSKHKLKTKNNKTTAPKVNKKSDDDFLEKLLKNMDENLMKTGGLYTSSVKKLPQQNKKKSLCSEGTLKLINDFKASYKGTRANTIPLLKTNDGNNAALPGSVHDETSLPQTPTLEKMSSTPKYSRASDNYDSEDLFELPLFQGGKHSSVMKNHSSSLKFYPMLSRRTRIQSENYPISNEGWARDVDYNSFMSSSSANSMAVQRNYDSTMLMNVNVSPPSMFSLNSPNRQKSHE